MTGRAIAAGLMIGAWLPHAGAEGIFTCVDGKGRRLTADRPIVECIDREQREISPGGIVKRKIGPSLTAQERAAEEDKARQAAEERSRLAEEKRRERALLTRYPDLATHTKERTAANDQADEVIGTARERVVELDAQRRRLDQELEFFNNDPSRLPPKLKRQLEENEQQMEAQKRFVANQEAEKRRVNARFDEELAKLRKLWAEKPTTAAKR